MEEMQPGLTLDLAMTENVAKALVDLSTAEQMRNLANMEQQSLALRWEGNPLNAVTTEKGLIIKLTTVATATTMMMMMMQRET